jgi:hypothetical protein
MWIAGRQRARPLSLRSIIVALLCVTAASVPGEGAVLGASSMWFGGLFLCLFLYRNTPYGRDDNRQPPSHRDDSPTTWTPP